VWLTDARGVRDQVAEPVTNELATCFQLSRQAEAEPDDS
jgi:hypothetical protein